MFEKLPEILKKEAGFILWRYEERKGKPTKVPYRINGAKADATSRSHFSSFDAVKCVFDKGGYDGIGIFVEPQFSAIDIDDCVMDSGLTEQSNAAKRCIFRLQIRLTTPIPLSVKYCHC